MDGLEGAIVTAITRLKAALPVKTAELRTRYDVDDETEGHLLPDVIRVEAFDQVQLGVEEWPAVLVAGLTTPAMELHVVRPGKQVWKVRYQLRAFVFVRASDAPTVVLVRNRLTLAVREILLQRTQLTSNLVVDPRSLEESYSELAVDEEDQQTIGGAWIGFQAVAVEELDDVDQPPTGDLDSRPTLDTGVLPPHPAL
jgi:hypothetical protein